MHFRDIGAFLASVVWHWGCIMSGIGGLGIQIVERLTAKHGADTAAVRHHSFFWRNIFWVGGIIFILLAFFLAWEDQKTLRESAERDAATFQKERDSFKILAENTQLRFNALSDWALTNIAKKSDPIPSVDTTNSSTVVITGNNLGNVASVNGNSNVITQTIGTVIESNIVKRQVLFLNTPENGSYHTKFRIFIDNPSDLDPTIHYDTPKYVHILNSYFTNYEYAPNMLIAPGGSLYSKGRSGGPMIDFEFDVFTQNPIRADNFNFYVPIAK